MKQANLAFMSIAILGAGLLGISSTSLIDADNNDLNQYGERTVMLGHVTAVHTDASGNIIAYSQSDNAITAQGESCLAFLTFATENGTAHGCATNETFNEISLFDSTQNLDDADDTYGTYLSSNGLAPCEITNNGGVTASGCEDLYKGIDSTGSVFLQATFTSTADSQEVEGAAVTNNGTSDTQFAGRNFSSTLTLNTNDKLTVTWDIDLA